MSEKNAVSYFRNFVFGVEDGLVSTVGFLAGISVTGVDTKSLFVGGIVLICVEAFSMAAGSFLSEESAGEYEEKKETRTIFAYASGGIMFISYFVAGLIPLAPYVLLSRPLALSVSIVASLVALFVLGLASGTLSRVHPVKSGIRALIVGGFAIFIGIVIGSLAEGSFS